MGTCCFEVSCDAWQPLSPAQPSMPRKPCASPIRAQGGVVAFLRYVDPIGKCHSYFSPLPQVIRNEALLLLAALTRPASAGGGGSSEVQKIAAFEGAFDRITELLREEGGLDGGMVVQVGGMVVQVGGMVVQVGGMVVQVGGMVVQVGGMVVQVGGMVVQVGGRAGPWVHGVAAVRWNYKSSRMAELLTDSNNLSDLFPLPTAQPRPILHPRTPRSPPPRTAWS